MARYGLVINVKRCIGCYGCTVACKNWYGIGNDTAGRRRIIEVAIGEYPEVSKWVFPVSCMQCEKAPCVSVCPVQATFRRTDGIVALDATKCIGCKKCISACPYNARYFDEKKSVADGCDLCSSRIDSGSKPYCVETCPTKAMVFGDLADRTSDAAKLIRSKKGIRFSPQLGTKPKVYYTGLNDQVAQEVRLR